MSEYLEDAAALLRKCVEENERLNRGLGCNLMNGRERLAREFAMLAAIDKGLLPAELTETVLDALRKTGDRRG
ncbi:hypothetical protein [Streptomyces sp. Z26]|uniref:hypothetical protein n=1 Tax=Streptomyces sp. Z26 TaxID=2500177 RepID=UPI0014052126|nr:hypothetical protein [Streptomyces sp. Z26]